MRGWYLPLEVTSLAGPGPVVSPSGAIVNFSFTLVGAGRGSSTLEEILTYFQDPEGESMSPARLCFDFAAIVLWQEEDAKFSEPPVHLKYDFSAWMVDGKALADWMDEVNLQVTSATVSSPDEINFWCSSVSEGQYKKLVDYVVPRSVVLAGVVQFAADWAVPFPADHTCSRPFKKLDGSVKEVSMMMMPAMELYVYRRYGFCTALRLDYKGGKFCAIVLLPDEDGNLTDVVKQGQEMAHILLRNAVPYVPKSVRLPSFQLTDIPDIKEDLREHDVRKLFLPGEADCSNFSSDDGVFVAGIHQKVMISVDEAGTRTKPSLTKAAGRAVHKEPEVELLSFDRPFVFSVHHVPSGTPTLAGIVLEP